MSDQQEEQEMEAEALDAIFNADEECFQVVQGDAMPFVWTIALWPEATEENHVGASLQVTLPVTYPDEELPEAQVTILKGLTQDHAATLLELAKEEAEANRGVPSIFAICERLREWLVEHNQKGHDDVSMHAQMLRRDAEAKKKEQQKHKLSTQFESQKAHDEMTDVEREELEIRRRRAEGTPVTRETFEEWKKTFEEELRQLQEKEVAAQEDVKSKKAKAKSAAAAQADENKAGRQTGFQQFSDTAFNLEALEAAAEHAQADPEEEEADHQAAAAEGNIQEDLFNVDDDDLDDLDFDDDDDDDDDEEEDVDI